MKKLNVTIVESSTPPEDKNVLWYTNGEIKKNRNNEWISVGTYTNIDSHKTIKLEFNEKWGGSVGGLCTIYDGLKAGTIINIIGQTSLLDLVRLHKSKYTGSSSGTYEDVSSFPYKLNSDWYSMEIHLVPGIFDADITLLIYQ